MTNTESYDHDRDGCYSVLNRVERQYDDYVIGYYRCKYCGREYQYTDYDNGRGRWSRNE